MNYKIVRIVWHIPESDLEKIKTYRELIKTCLDGEHGEYINEIYTSRGLSELAVT